MSNWEIEKSTGSCSKCERIFEEEEEYFSALYDEDAKFVRRDYCMSCWEEDSTSAMFSYWKTRIPSADDEAQKLVDDAVIMKFFARLEGEQDEAKKNFRYVLALLLIRKRKLKLRDVKREDDEEMLVLEVPDEAREVRVPARNLSEEEIQSLTHEVGQILRVKV